jgi:hypothetical protein
LYSAIESQSGKGGGFCLNNVQLCNIKLRLVTIKLRFVTIKLRFRWAGSSKSQNDPADVLEMTQKMLTKLETLDTTSWTNDDRERLRVALVALDEKITGLLNPNPGLA